MNQDIKQRWIDALRSGQYQQGIGRLRDAQDRFCCLGVLCDLYVKDNAELDSEACWEQGSDGDDFEYCLHDMAGVLPEEVKQWAELDEKNPCVRPPDLLGPITSLAALNDSGRVTFDDIATVIEEQL
jgi:hypothetical protein